MSVFALIMLFCLFIVMLLGGLFVLLAESMADTAADTPVANVAGVVAILGALGLLGEVVYLLVRLAAWLH